MKLWLPWRRIKEEQEIRDRLDRISAQLDALLAPAGTPPRFGTRAWWLQRRTELVATGLLVLLLLTLVGVDVDLLFGTTPAYDQTPTDPIIAAFTRDPNQRVAAVYLCPLVEFAPAGTASVRVALFLSPTEPTLLRLPTNGNALEYVGQFQYGVGVPEPEEDSHEACGPKQLSYQQQPSVRQGVDGSETKPASAWWTVGPAPVSETDALLSFDMPVEIQRTSYSGRALSINFHDTTIAPPVAGLHQELVDSYSVDLPGSKSFVDVPAGARSDSSAFRRRLTLQSSDSAAAILAATVTWSDDEAATQRDVLILLSGAGLGVIGGALANLLFAAPRPGALRLAGVVGLAVAIFTVLLWLAGRS
jgi:hypothetical protein